MSVGGEEMNEKEGKLALFSISVVQMQKESSSLGSHGQRGG